MKINEIFTSIDGEVNKWGQGILTTFIRTQGCNFRCVYCDTPLALDVELDFCDTSVKDVVDKVANIGCNKITITGGEPLMQKDIWVLISALQSLHYNISIETNGAYKIPTVFLGIESVCWVVDYKWECAERMNVDWKALTDTDWIKFVVSKENANEIVHKIKEMRGEGVQARIAVSAVDSKEHKWLADLLVKEEMWDVSLNVQIHKALGIR